ncbi:DNA-binding protein [Mycobacterium sp.]|uniref:DNA-binding protein n=1 Tax=Mycobacterium sp. TaxID=1785 RepID=UPI0025CF5581|nr:DNA-binding protein [Mycobacterium sp.]
MTADELDALLRDRFDLSLADLVPALKTLPARDYSSGSLSPGEAQLLDHADFPAVPERVAEGALDVVVLIAQLIKSAYSAADVAAGLGVSNSAVEQRRRARTLWAVDVDGSCVYPAAQFTRASSGGRPALELVRNLDRVLPALPEDLHPAAIAGFLSSPQHDLILYRRTCTVREWLTGGGAVESVLQLIEMNCWAS